MSNPTQKQALEEAQTKITELEGKVSAAEGLQAKLDEATTKLSTAETLAGTEKSRADQAEQKASAEKTRADGLQTKLDETANKLSTAETKVGEEKKRADDAEAKVANADQRHQEASASRGIKPPKKDAASVAAEGDAKPTADQIKAQYAAIEDRAERRAFFQKHKSLLMA